MPLDQAEADDVTDGPAESEPAESKSRGAAPKKPRAVEARAARRVTGRTVYVPDDLWERVIVQSHRRNKTFSEYVVGILERQVPDHRVVRGPEESAA